MPRGDRTGPMGMGAMTGRGAGYCAGFDRPGFMNPVGGVGFGGRGSGRRGRRNMFYATGLTGWQRAGYQGYQDVQPETELDALKIKAETMESSLNALKDRIETLESNSKE